jgi:hypothetical protein
VLKSEGHIHDYPVEISEATTLTSTTARSEGRMLVKS